MPKRSKKRPPMKSKFFLSNNIDNNAYINHVFDHNAPELPIPHMETDNTLQSKPPLRFEFYSSNPPPSSETTNTTSSNLPSPPLSNPSPSNQNYFQKPGMRPPSASTFSRNNKNEKKFPRRPIVNKSADLNLLLEMTQ